MQVLLGSSSHLHLWEQGGTAMVGGVHSRVLGNRWGEGEGRHPGLGRGDGTFCLEELGATVQVRQVVTDWGMWPGGRGPSLLGDCARLCGE